MFNSFYLYKFLQAGGDCFSNMVILSKGLVNFFLWLCQFFKKMKSSPAKFESFGLCIPGNFLVTL